VVGNVGTLLLQIGQPQFSTCSRLCAPHAVRVEHVTHASVERGGVESGAVFAKDVVEGHVSPFDEEIVDEFRVEAGGVGDDGIGLVELRPEFGDPVDESSRGVSSSHSCVTIDLVDHRLEIPFQMRPAPLQASHLPVHLRPIAGDDALELLGQEDAERRGLAGGANREHRECSGHERPQPRLAVFFLGRRLVDVQMLLRRQFGGQLLIRRPQRFGHLVLDFHRQRWAAWLAQQRGEELDRPPLALTIEGHQQRGERHGDGE